MIAKLDNKNLLSSEQIESQTIRAAIPFWLMDRIKQSGTNPLEVKGMYLSPKHSLNPYPGKHFIGENPVSSIDFDTMLVAKLSDQLTSGELDSDVNMVAQQYGQKLKEWLKEGLSPFWVDISKKSILIHEETHRDQNIRFGYLDTFEEVAQRLRQLSSSPNFKTNSDLVEQFYELNTLYKSTYVLSETQALSKGLCLLDEENHFVGNEQENQMYQVFAHYWVGKIFQLFSRYDGNSKNQTVFDEVFTRISENNMFFEDMDNIINQLARIVFLTGDANLIKKIRNGEIEKEELKLLIINGLSEFIANPINFIATADSSDISGDEYLISELNTLKSKLNTNL